MKNRASFLARLTALAALVGLLSFSNTPSLAQERATSADQQQAAKRDAPATDLASLENFIDGYVAAKMVDMEPPGMSVAVVTPQGVITRGYGLADTKTGREADEDTLFRIGSISKLFVWLSVHALAEEGKLDLEADINTYLDGFQIPEADGGPVTMRDLMAHRGGFEDSLRDFVDPDRGITLGEALAREIPARVAPAGERASYSNTGTNLAAYVVEQVSGSDYYDFVRSRILEPAGMTSTSLRDPGTDQNPAGLDERTALPHVMERGHAVPKLYMPVRPQEPVGAVSMSARDAAIFLQMLLNGTQMANGERLLSPESWARIATHAFPDGQGSDDMSWGFMLNDVDGVPTIGHGGATKFLSWLFVLPEKGIGVFVSSNMSSRETRGEDVAWSIVRRLAGTNALAAFEAREGDVKAAKEVAGTYLTNRRTFFGAVALFFIGTETTVTADKGFIVVDGDTRYAPLGNDVWVALNGFRLRAARGEDGSIVRLHTSLGSATLERVSFWGSTRPIVFAIGLSAFLAVTTLLGMWYRTGRKTQTTQRGRRAMWIACVSAVLWVVFTALLIPTLSTFSNLDLGTLDKTGFPITLTLTLATLAALALQAIIHVLGLYFVWVGSGWGLWRRVHYTMFGLVFAYAMIRIAQFGAIGVPLYG